MTDTEPFQRPQTLCSYLCSSKTMKKSAAFEIFTNSAGVTLQRRSSTYHHSQCTDQETTALRGLVISPRKKYQGWKSEALLYHLGCTATPQTHKIRRALSHHMSWATHTSRYLEWEILGDESRQIPAKKIQLETALPGTSPRAGKLQMKLSKMPK